MSDPNGRQGTPAKLDPAAVERWRQHWNAQGIKPTERQARLIRQAFGRTDRQHKAPGPS